MPFVPPVALISTFFLPAAFVKSVANVGVLGTTINLTCSDTLELSLKVHFHVYSKSPGLSAPVVPISRLVISVPSDRYILKLSLNPLSLASLRISSDAFPSLEGK